MVVRTGSRQIKLLPGSGLKFAFIAQTTLMRKYLFLLTAAFLASTCFAQVRVGVFAGIADYQGDLTEKIFQNPRFAFGINGAYQITSRINLRAGLSFAKVSGADSLSSQRDLQLRNLSFQTSITELSLIGEYDIFDMDLKPWSPYAFAGIAVYHFNPYTFDRSGNKIFLQPLSTEGQGLPGYPNKPYSLTQLAIPFGGGIKYDISSTVRIALEFGMRKLFTDYLDDVSGNYADPNELFANKGQTAVDLSYRGDEVAGGNLNYPVKGFTRGSPKYKDYYYFTGIHLMFRLPEGGGGGMHYSPKGRNKRYGCPTNF